MKRTRKLWVAAAAMIAAVLMAGCNGLTGVTVDDSAGGNGRRMVTMTGNIINYDEMDGSPISAEGGARTILPEAGKRNDYKYYLYGVSVNGLKFGDSELKEISLQPSTDSVYKSPASFTAVIEPSVWEFILFASDSALTSPGADNINETWILENSKLVAYANADLENSGIVNFTLSPDGVKGEGIVNFKVVSKNADALWYLDENSYEVSAEVKNLFTGETVNWEDTPSSATTTAIEWTKGTDSSNTGAVTAVAFGGAAKELKPGTYNFVVTITDKKDAKKQFVWSDILVVIAGRSIKDDVNVPNIIGAAPGNVTSLSAAFIDESTDLPGHEGFYQMALQWTNNTNNETHFKLQLMDATGRTAKPAADDLSDPINPVTEWKTTGSDKNTVEYEENFWGVPERVEEIGGSLLANNTTVCIWAELGKSYYARIKAVNNVGESPEWTEVKILKGLTGTASELMTFAASSPLNGKTPKYFNDIAKGDESTSATTAAMFMNRFRITYDLNGGTYDDETSHDDITVNKKDYHTVLNPGSITPVRLWEAVHYKKESDFGAYISTNTYYKLDSGNYVKLTDAEKTAATPNVTNFSGLNWYSKHSLNREGSDFKFWVLDTNAYDNKTCDLTSLPENANNDKTVVYSSDNGHHYKNDTLNKSNTVLDKDFKADTSTSYNNGGYAGWDNVTVYAEYAYLNASVNFDEPTDYVLYANWIKYDIDTVSASNPVTTATTAVTSANKAIAKLAAPAKTLLTFHLKIPGTGEDLAPAFTEQYDQYTMEVKDLRKNITKAQSTVDTKGKPLTDLVNFAQFDVTNWSSGTYMIYFTATKKDGSRTIIRQVPVMVDITD